MLTYFATSAAPGAEVQRFLVHLERAGGDEGAAIEAFNGNHHIEMASSSNRSSSSKKSAGLPKKSSFSASSVIVNVGDVGYKFRKQFDDGWYEGVVVKIRPGAGECYCESMPLLSTPLCSVSDHMMCSPMRCLY